MIGFEGVPPEIEDATNATTIDLLRSKSIERYKSAYEIFMVEGKTM